MNFEQTQRQTTEEQQRAQALSLTRSRPPAQVPGYEPRRFLGAGAYGEVWVAVDRNTGRQVAIKFYAHRGGLDWSLLSREVEKLAFLSADRYVVQLLDVGWDSEPPYYVMEYVERGSLEQHLKTQGRLPANEAVALFRDVAVGLLHAHGKGVLHCDLKPANVLLDQDSKPRLADFGQSRLSYEQTPALGTLFYMAPEQADLKAMPDVRWDVYALGALLYCMLTGAPPHRTDQTVAELEQAADLDDRLSRYRALIEKSPPPWGHRQVRGVDGYLEEIIDTCLAVDREQRYANVQEVIDALDSREMRRARKPRVWLGVLATLAIFATVLMFAWGGFEPVLRQTDQELRTRALDTNEKIAKYVAKSITTELNRRSEAVENLATSLRFENLLEATLADPELARLREKLSDPKMDEAELAPLRAQFLENPLRLALQRRLDAMLSDESENSISWFVTDDNGLQLAWASREMVAGQDPTGRNFAWRTYFQGRGTDFAEDWRPKGPDDHLTETKLSAVFLSQADNRWKVAISTPVVEEEADQKFLGVVAFSVDVSSFIIEYKEYRPNESFAVLVDFRGGDTSQGRILYHPLFEQLAEKTAKEHGSNPEEFQKYRLDKDDLPEKMKMKGQPYVDPIGNEPEGREFHQNWLAAQRSVEMRDGLTGWMVIVQESYDGTIGRNLSQLKTSLGESVRTAVVVLAVLSAALWGYFIWVLQKPLRRTASQVVPKPPLVEGPPAAV